MIPRAAEYIDSLGLLIIIIIVIRGGVLFKSKNYSKLENINIQGLIKVLGGNHSSDYLQ
mgnify:CR=1 FL=1